MDECELISFITATACAIAKNCPEDEITLLAAVFTQLGDTLATVLTKRSLAGTGDNKDTNHKDCSIDSNKDTGGR